MKHILFAPALLLALSACGDSTDDKATPGGGVGIPENQGMNSGTVGDGAPDAVPAQPPAAMPSDQTAKQVDGMNYPATGQQ